jgi:DNA-binding response OmpR family regulator
MLTEKVRILTIDDEEDFCFFVKKNLERIGYEVICAGDGRSGAEFARQRKPHVVLLDILMPGIDGFEVLQILKGDDQTQSIPVIMLTGKDDDESRQKAAALRNDDYLVKPVELEELSSRIEKALAKKSRH